MAAGESVVGNVGPVITDSLYTGQSKAGKANTENIKVTCEDIRDLVEPCSEIMPLGPRNTHSVLDYKLVDGIGCCCIRNRGTKLQACRG